MRSLLLAAFAAIALVACQSDSDAFSRPSSITIEIDYESGGEPTLGTSGFAILADNVDALFPDLPFGRTIPEGLADLEDVGVIDAETYTARAILDIAADHRDGRTQGDAHHHYVIFLDGYYEDSTGVRMDVLGLSIGTTGVVAMFTPALAYSGVFFPAVRAFVIQTVLVHEFGHTIGLVDNGIAMVRDHHDDDHEAHCSNEDCVMFWANEGLADLVDFANTRMTSGSNVLFDPDCLDDVHAHYGP